jgi:hypothetical protein
MHGRVDFDAANQTDRCHVVNGQKPPVGGINAARPGFIAPAT